MHEAAMQVSDIFAAKVPRYTSYPTAPHFHAGIDQGTYRQWLTDIAAGTPLSLYLHIPFCDTLCWFCGCHTAVVNNYAPVHDYCDLLLREIELVAGVLGSQRPVQHIHWGGGSPSMLQPADIARLNRAVCDRFDVAPDAEFAVEIDPRGLTQETVAAFAKAGLTRASIGVQDCDPAVQKAINRVQSREETLVAIAMLRNAGVKSINIDLLYGLPHQMLENWEATLHFALELAPDRLAVFGYAHVPTFKKHQALIPGHLLPDLETRLRQAELANQILCTHGYVAVGLDHFARPGDAMAQAAMQGTLARNFQGYTTDKAPVLIGLGASAISALPQGYVQNFAAVPIYRPAVTQGQLPIQRGVALSRDDRIRRHVIERLMCDMAVDLCAARTAFGENPAAFDEALAALAPLAKQGIVSVEGDTISILPRWRVATRLVCAAFDTYLARGGSKHSVSV
jgi:oxygen-independent coproporphyrinogen-3 oxidase